MVGKWQGEFGAQLLEPCFVDLACWMTLVSRMALLKEMH
jgi:hypothetical protein